MNNELILKDQLNLFDEVVIHIYDPNGEDENSYLSYCTLYIHKTNGMYRAIFVPDAYLVDFIEKYSAEINNGIIYKLTDC